MIKIVSWVATFLSIIGAVILSLANSLSPYGFILMLIQNILFLWVFYQNKDKALIFLNIAFILINGLAVYNWVII